MATKTEVTATATVTVAASTKVAALIVAVVQAVIGAVNKKRALSEGVRLEADRLGLDRKQASQMVALSYVEAYDMAKAPEAQLNAFNLKMRPDVSKVIALAFPDKPKELQLANAHNDKLPKGSPKHNRIGENNLLRIARGEITCAEALATKAASKTPASGLDTVTTPIERFANSIKGILAMHKVGDKGKVTADEATEAFNTTLDQYLNPKTAKAAKQ